MIAWISRKVPNVLKPILRPIYYKVVAPINEKLASRTRPPRTYHQFWIKKKEVSDYLRGEDKSRFLIELIKKHYQGDGRVLEIGCCVGRNLNHLFLNGYQNLAGIEINKLAIQTLKESYPEMAKHSNLYNSSVESMIKDIEDNTYDVVFTMAVLEHIPPKSEWIFPEIVRITKHLLITIEDEKAKNRVKFPRNYKPIFEQAGMKQIDETNDCKGLSNNFVARTFSKISI